MIDVYSYLASEYFNCSIEDCMTIDPDGILNHDDALKRNLIKRTLLSKLNDRELNELQKDVWNYLVDSFPSLSEISSIPKPFNLVEWLNSIIKV